MNSGLLYGSGRALSPPRVFDVASVDAVRVARSLAIDVVNRCVPALRECILERYPKPSPGAGLETQEALVRLVEVLRCVAYGQPVDRGRFWGVYDTLEAECARSGLGLTEPSTFTGRIGQRLRNRLKEIDAWL